MGERPGKGNAYGNLGNAHYCLGDCKTAKDYGERHLKIAENWVTDQGKGTRIATLAMSTTVWETLKQPYTTMNATSKLRKNWVKDRGKWKRMAILATPITDWDT